MNPWIVYGCFFASGVLCGVVLGAALMLAWMIRSEGAKIGPEFESYCSRCKVFHSSKKECPYVE